jgi:arsenate reductase (thioredoxin)
MEKKKVLLQQRPEPDGRAWMNHLCGERFRAESAGLEPGTLNQLVITAMKEIGLDLSGKETRSVSVVYRYEKIFSYVITVCDESAAERCPISPGLAKRLHRSITDPGSLQGMEQEKPVVIREIRDDIRKAVEVFCAQEA